MFLSQFKLLKLIDFNSLKHYFKLCNQNVGGINHFKTINNILNELVINLFNFEGFIITVIV